MLEQLKRFRKPIAIAILVGGGTWVAHGLLKEWPQETQLRFLTQEQFRELTVEYVLNGETVRKTTFRGNANDRKIEQKVSLKPGLYRINMKRESAAGMTTLHKGALVVPTDDIVTLKF